MVDVYESAVEEAGRFGAVFERDDETAFFYLLDLHKQEGSQIVSAFSTDVVNNMPYDVPVVPIRLKQTPTRCSVPPVNGVGKRLHDGDGHFPA